MLRRSILEISSRRTIGRNPRHFVSQKIPSYLSSRKQFSTSSKPGRVPAPSSHGQQPPKSQGFLSKFVIGSVAVGAAFLAAYQNGYLDQYLKNEQHNFPQETQSSASIGELKGDQILEDVHHLTEQLDSPNSEKFNIESPTVERVEQKADIHIPQLENVIEEQGNEKIQVDEKTDIAGKDNVDAKENQLPEHSQSSAVSDDSSKEFVIQSEGSVDTKSTEMDIGKGIDVGIQHATMSTQANAVPDDNGMVESIQPQHHVMEEKREFMLVAKSNYIRQLIMESDEHDLSKIDLLDILGGPEIFEKVAKFCYGLNSEITVNNIAALRCAAKFLQMTDKYCENNLASRSEDFLSQVGLSSLSSAVIVLKSCQQLLPFADQLSLVKQCIEVGTLDKDIEQLPPLLEAYHLKDKFGEGTSTYLYSHGFNENSHFSEDKEALSNVKEGLKDGYISKDGILILDFLQAIHAAEKRQADLDAHVFNEEKRMLKEKYEKKLKDAAARELMRAEEAAMLDKELKRERSKAALAIKSFQDKMEEKLKKELEQKESESEMNIKKAQELAKAELNAAIANEKASQIEKMAEANVNINALCMAFYARSEEARQTHAAHKLTLGALALEDSLSKGLPIQTEIASLQSYLAGIDKDSLLDLVLESLPDETQYYGTDTLLQLNQKFDALKGTLRHFSFFPLGGGGILSHSLAHLASWLKVKEVDESGDGIESIINKVDSYLAEGKLAEAADVLEESVRDTQAAEIVADWVRQARNRAITEQALTLLQSYATSISLT